MHSYLFVCFFVGRASTHATRALAEGRSEGSFDQHARTMRRTGVRGGKEVRSDEMMAVHGTIGLDYVQKSQGLSICRILVLPSLGDLSNVGRSPLRSAAA